MVLSRTGKPLVALGRGMNMKSIESLPLKGVCVLMRVAVVAPQSKYSELPRRYVAKNHREIHNVERRLPEPDFELATGGACKLERPPLVLVHLIHLLHGAQSRRDLLSFEKECFYSSSARTFIGILRFSALVKDRGYQQEAGRTRSRQAPSAQSRSLSLSRILTKAWLISCRQSVICPVQFAGKGLDLIG